MEGELARRREETLLNEKRGRLAGIWALWNGVETGKLDTDGTGAGRIV